MRSFFTASALSLWAATADAFANPMACSGVCTNAHDPALIRRDDGTYFRFSTGNKIAVHTAPNILGPWTHKGSALPGGSRIPKRGNQDLWAPDVAKVGNTYYLYYTVSSFGTQDSAIGVATSPDMNVWTDQGSTGVESVGGDKWNAIDGNLAFSNGRLVMNFGSFWSDLFQIEMRNPPTRLNGNLQDAKQISFVPRPPQAQEAAFTFQWGDFHYLFFSVGACCGFDANRPAPGAEYKIQACRSNDIAGPYVDRNGVSCLQGGGTTVLESHGFVYGPGGQGVYNDPGMGPVLYYHYVDTRIGFADGQKQFGVNRINFASGWPEV